LTAAPSLLHIKQMDAVLESPQRIARLTSVADVLAAVDRLVKPVAPFRGKAGLAIGRILASDLSVPQPRPPRSIAARDGWAVPSDQTIDAGTYAPAILADAPVWVETGDALPLGADAVADFDAVRERTSGWEALAPLAPGEGVLAAGTDAAASEILRRAGQMLRATDAAALEALELDAVSIRQPCIRLAAARADHIVDAAIHCLAGLIILEGGLPDPEPPAADLDAALMGAGADLVVIIGGTGTGARDRSVATLARLGQVTCHGVALAPGETSAFGQVADTPVLLVPGRLDAALSAWLVIGRYIMARLAARTDTEPTLPCALSRKLVSSLGMSEFVLLRRDGDAAAPLASGYLPLSAIAQADGYVLVPPDSEGYPAGARIEMKVLR
jgi:molybdopterin molybdotransferase